ncbi:hypothetical protein [Protofrankia coriariae]|nr:hypothetical protein [Protofrankia coriariae]
MIGLVRGGGLQPLQQRSGQQYQSRVAQEASFGQHASRARAGIRQPHRRTSSPIPSIAPILSITGGAVSTTGRDDTQPL